ncbi:MAG: c-type cytochrome [Fidelibacterota bacterium]
MSIIHQSKSDWLFTMVKITVRMARILPISLVLFLTTSDVGYGQEELPTNPLQGRYVFEQKGCVKCHMPDGAGPDLMENEYYGSALDLASTMWNHLPRMMLEIKDQGLSFPNFTSNEFSDLLTYIFYLRYLGKPGKPEAGATIFSQKGCARCHTLAGQGGNRGPALDTLSQFVSPLFLAQALWNHGPQMGEEIENSGMEFPQFQKEEMVDLQAYIRSAGSQAEKKRIFQSPGNPQNGKLLFREKGCINCHKIGEEGNDEAPNLEYRQWDLSVNEIAAILWNHSLDMHQLMEEKNLIWPHFTSSEMADVIAYLYFMGFNHYPGDYESGEKAFREKGCVQCHAINPGSLPDNIGANLNLSSGITMAQLMWNHAPLMETKASKKVVDWPELSGGEMSNIYWYLKTLMKKEN